MFHAKSMGSNLVNFEIHVIVFCCIIFYLLLVEKERKGKGTLDGQFVRFFP